MNDKELQTVAIEYGEYETPIVSAMGKGDLAEKILAIAKKEGVPIYKDEDLVALLSMLELHQDIPVELYRLVAEVLAFSYWLRGMKPGDEKGKGTSL
jgi:flagellar biosynthesis protein